MAPFIEINNSGISDEREKVTKIQVMLYLSFRQAPTINKKTGSFFGDATLDIRFNGPPKVYEVTFTATGRLTKNGHSFFPDIVTYSGSSMSDRLVGLNTKELTAIGTKLASVIRQELTCNCKPITADKYDIEREL